MESSFYLPIFLIAGGIIFLIIFFHYVPFFLWLSAKVSGVHISLIQLFLMRIRNVPPYIIVPGMIEAHKAGLKNITRDELEAHYLAGGHVEKVVHALVSASKANIELPFQMATAIDLAGRDVFEAVQMSVNPKVIDTPPVTAVAKDGIQLIAKARVTVRANIRQLVGGAGEDTILARVGEGIVSSIGSSENHKSVLENPDSISKLVLRKDNIGHFTTFLNDSSLRITDYNCLFSCSRHIEEFISSRGFIGRGGNGIHQLPPLRIVLYKLFCNRDITTAIYQIHMYFRQCGRRLVSYCFL